MRTQLGVVSVDILPGWADVTEADEEGGEGSFTFAREAEDACGAFQLSFALYSEGPVSEPTPDELAEMLHEFAVANALEDASDEHREPGPLRLAAATFHDEEYIVRVWFVSDGANFAQATYTAEKAVQLASELEDCERMVRSLEFPKWQAP